METFWDFYISCFSFSLLDRPILVHPSIKLRLILKIKRNDFFGCFLQLAKLQEKEIFFRALYLRPILRGARSLPSPLVFFFYFAWVSCNTVACVNCISTHFPWYFLGGGEEDGPCYTFSSFLFWEGHRGGDGTSTILCICLHLQLVKKIDSVKLKSPSYFPVQSFLLFPCFLVLSPHLYCQEISLPLFFCSISFFFLFLVFTL